MPRIETQAPEPFDPGAFAAALARAGLHAPVIALATTASTNDDAMREARAGAPHGTVVVADRQTAGRGRLGRAWWDEPGTALLASWVARPAMPTEEWPLLPLLAGVAASQGVEAATGLRVRLKWPNDLLANEHGSPRKLGGILAEADVGAGAVVIGLGLNVHTREFPSDVRDVATSVVAAGGRPAPRADILAAVLAAFARALGDPPAALAAYRATCDTLGAAVRVERPGREPLRGVARDVDARGSLIVETADGAVAIAAGDVQHLRVGSARP